MPLKADKMITNAAVITAIPTTEIRVIQLTRLRCFRVYRRYLLAMKNETLIFQQFIDGFSIIQRIINVKQQLRDFVHILQTLSNFTTNFTRILLDMI